MVDGTFGEEKAYGYPAVNIEDRHSEIQAIYGEVFARSERAGRASLLRNYTANFPHLAFDPDSWLWPLWQEWRARYGKSDRPFLRALANGIKAQGDGWMSAKRARVWRIAQARTRLSNFRRERRISDVYQEYLEGVRTRDSDVQANTKKRVLPRLIEQINRVGGYSTSEAELRRLKLSGVLRRAASHPIGVRERDLH
jgi:hypothetical protein